MSASGEFIESAVEQYGITGGQELCATILNSVDFAGHYHDLRWPLQTIKLGFSSWPDRDEGGVPMLPVIGISDGYYGFGMMFNTAYPLEVLKLGVRPIAVHETSHVAQFQEGWLSGEYAKGGQGFTFLKYVFNEGAADWHASRCQSRLYGSLVSVALHHPKSPNIGLDVAAELAHISTIGTDFPTSELVDYLQGDPDCPKKGYRLGLYIVQKALALKLVKATELVSMTNLMVQSACETILSAIEASKPSGVSPSGEATA